MTNITHDEYIKKFKKCLAEETSTIEKTKELLVRAGIYTREGKLTKKYRTDNINIKHKK